MSVNAVLLYRTKLNVESDKKIAEEAAKPAEIEITVLAAPACAQCYDVNVIMAPLKSNARVKITSEKNVEYTSA